MSFSVRKEFLSIIVLVAVMLPGKWALSTAHPICIDGVFDDWAGMLPAYMDPAGDEGHTGIDLTSIYIANDDRFLFLKFDVGVELNLQGGLYLKLFLDTDNNPATGFAINDIGAELVWTFGQRYGRFYWNGNNTEVNFDQIRLRGGPTVTSNTFEIALGRHELPDGVHPLFPQSTFKMVIKDDTWDYPGHADGDTAPEEGEFIEYTFDDAHVPEPPTIDLNKNRSDFIRVATYNTFQDGLFDWQREDSFKRVLTALNPDILNFQEVWSSPEDVRAKIAQWLPLDKGIWHVLGSGDRVTVSRVPIITDWPESHDPLDDRFTVVLVQVDDVRKLLIFNAHMSCCENDDRRQREADSFIAYMRDLMTPGGNVDIESNTPILLVGDLNLVGYAQQLQTLLTGEIVNQAQYGPSHTPDWDGSDLYDLISRQTELRMAYTWRKDTSSYWPGRMDFIIYSDSVMTADTHFTLYTGEMKPENLAAYGLVVDDTQTASDHLPVVADIYLTDGEDGNGDVNYDGKINVVDLLYLKLMILSDIPATNYQLWMADLNADGKVDAQDVALMMGIISEN